MEKENTEFSAQNLSQPVPTNSCKWAEFKAWASSFRGMLALICFVGVALRLELFLENRSLWFDEATLSINYVTRSFSKLFEIPLDHGQTAPIGFLLLQKSFFHLFGKTDWAVRLVPLLASIGAVFLMARLSVNVLGRKKLSLIPLLFFALSPRIIYYASEAKQYSTDVFCALLLFSYFEKSLNKQKFKHLLKFIATAAVCIFFSQPTIFVSFVLFGFLVFRLIFSAKKSGEKIISTHLMTTFCGGILTAGFFLINYKCFLEPYTKLSWLVDYWHDFYMPMPPWKNLGWFLFVWKDFTSLTLGLYPGMLVLLVFLLGMVWILRKKSPILLAAGTLFLLILVASAFKKYPAGGFGGRLILFCLPVFYLVLGAGFFQAKKLIEKAKKYREALIVMDYCLLGVLLLSNLLGLGFFRHAADEPIKPLLAQIRKDWRPGDIIYLHPHSVAPFGFYREKYGFAPSEIFAPKFPVDIGQASFEMCREKLMPLTLKGKARVWALFTHTYNGENLATLKALDELGSGQQMQVQKTSSLYRYELGNKR